jgi:alpha-tubulin suppressor-like RCC1 family protein
MSRLGSLGLLFLAMLLCTKAHAGFISKTNPSSAAAEATPSQAEPSFANLSSANPGQVHKKYRAGELMVKFRRDATPGTKKSLHKRHGAAMLREFSDLHLHHVRLKKGMTLEEAVQLYQADPTVLYAEPNFLYQVQVTPNDPNYSRLWGLSKINAAGAWNATTGSSDAVVAIIDTGIDFTHPDLQANLWLNPADHSGSGRDDDGNGYINDAHGVNTITGSGNPMDDNGHGTHVAGTIGASGNNGLGVVGVNWSTRIMACKFLDASGSGSASDAIDCLSYVKAMKARGVNIVATNNSWSGGGFSQALYDAINAQPDILFVAAAGNSGLDSDANPVYPAGYKLPNVISVAATDNYDNRATFSNYGQSSVQVAAPGVDILSTLPAANAWGITGGYGSLSGTSMATPHVTGLAALLKAQDPSRSTRQIKNLILSGGDDLAALAGHSVTGKRINAFGSLGASACTDHPLLSVAALPARLVPGRAYTLSVLSINCDAPAGPVTVTSSDGATTQLSDLDGDGVFTGPWTQNSFPVTLTFSSPAGTRSLLFSLLRVITFLPEARQDAPYAQRLTATGGSSYTWAITGGTLPAGLTLDPASGTISGTASVAGTYPLTAEVTDSNGARASANLTLVVNGQGWLDMAWGKVYDGPSFQDDRGLGVASDAAGNSYVTGQTKNGATWNLLLLKYDPAGNLLWSRSYDRGGDEIGRSIACDRNGDLYISGTTGALGRHLLLKYNAAGELLWDRSWDRGGQEGGWGVVTDAAGYVYTVGGTNTGQGERILLSKYDPEGNVVWTRSHQSALNPQYARAIAVDGSGNVFFGGRTELPSPVGTFIYCLAAKYDAGANLLWSVQRNPQQGDCDVSSVAVDASGSLYGLFVGADQELRKFNPDGTPAWSALTLTDSLPSMVALATAGGQIYVAGKGYSWAGGLSLVAYDATGQQLWYQRIDAGGLDSATGVSADAAGVTITGFRDSVNLSNGHNDNGAENDVISARFQAAPACYDPAVTGLSAYLLSGDLFYTLKVKNYGTGNPAPHAGLYFSADPAASTGNYLIGSLLLGPLHGPSETTLSNSLSLPYSTPPGTYYLSAIVNMDRALQETDSSNDSIVAGAFTVDRDLIISRVSGTVAAGMLNYSVTQSNIGNLNANWSTTGVYLSRTPVASPADYLVASFSALNKNTSPAVYFPAGSELVLTGSAPLPADLPAGTYYITASADITNRIPESNESNNSAIGNAVLGPDFSIGNLSGTVSGGQLSYSVTVKNGGTAGAAPALALSFSGAAAVSANDYPVGRIEAGEIAPGAEVTLAGRLPVPVAIPAGIYFLTALADPAQAISETDETNNAAATSTTYLLGASPATLRYSRTGTGTGTVNFTPGPSCKGDCSPYFDAQTVVTLTASPDPGSSLRGWGGACAGTGACTLVPQGDQAVSAQFDSVMAVTSISAGHWFSAAAIDGAVWTWGINTDGQLGDGSVIWRPGPARLPGLSGITAVVASMADPHTLALQSGGTVWAWGQNTQGQLGDGTTLQRNSPVPVPGLTNIKALAAGSGSNMALQDDGTLWTWGNNSYGGLGDGTTTERFSPTHLAGISQVTAIASGAFHDLALRSDGTLWAWGNNNYGQLGDGTSTNRKSPLPSSGLTDVVAIAAGYYHSVALKKDGTVWTWGGNWEGQVGDGTLVTRSTPFKVPGLTGVTAIAAGSAYTVALKSDGTVVAWGDNYYGQLGDGTKTVRTSPVQVPGLSGVVRISCGYDHTLAAKSDGTVVGWGNNYCGQLGNGIRLGTSTRMVFDTTVPTSSAVPAGGSYAASQIVTLTSDEPAVIHYTLDGSAPSATAPLYSAPITIAANAVLKFFATDSSGNVEAVRTERYTIGPVAPPVADFSASATSGRSPLSVVFSDTSSGAINSWFWNFGDGLTGTAQNPVHYYAAPGSYTVSLTVTGAGGASTRTKADFIVSSNPGPADIQPLYDVAADQARILVLAGELTESPVCNRNVSVRIEGGYDLSYQQVTGSTVIHGKLTVNNGTVGLGNLVFK